MRSGKLKVFFIGILTVQCFLVLFPLLWAFVSSIKPTDQLFSLPIRWIPEKITWQHYLTVISTSRYLRYFVNTFYVSIISTVLAIILAASTGYGFSRFRIKGKKGLTTFILSSQMFPPIMIVIPYFTIMRGLSLYNTYTTLIITRIVFILPFAILMLKSYFDTLPFELEESAMVEGCTKLQAFTKIIIPLSYPGVASIVIFSFIRSWNEFLFSLSLTSSDAMRTITVGMTTLIAQYSIRWDHLMAISILSMLPPLIIFIAAQEYFVRGLTAGALKG